jgi:hypothetical protein
VNSSRKSDWLTNERSSLMKNKNGLNTPILPFIFFCKRRAKKIRKFLQALPVIAAIMESHFGWQEAVNTCHLQIHHSLFTLQTFRIYAH